MLNVVPKSYATKVSVAVDTFILLVAATRRGEKIKKEGGVG